MISSSRSWFARLFAGEPGIDPYTRAVSDVYQDLFAEGSFVGKGIYDIDAFQRALAGRLPENRILSHDLLEGAYCRSGLVSDVTLFEDHPASYAADVSRRHRWIRGDWQIAAWLGWFVPPGQGGRVRNSISLLSRWKILDNLRRALVPIALLVLLIAGWWIPGAAASRHRRGACDPAFARLDGGGCRAGAAAARDRPWQTPREIARTLGRQLVPRAVRARLLALRGVRLGERHRRTLVRLLVTDVGCSSGERPATRSVRTNRPSREPTRRCGSRR